MKKYLVKILAMAMAFSLLFGVSAVAADEGTGATPELEGTVPSMDYFEKHGNLQTTITEEDFFAAGYQYGDIVTVSINGQDIDMPFCSDYTDVNDGEVVLLAKTGENTLKLAIHNKKFIEAYGIATYSKDAEENVVWTLCEGVTLPLTVKIKMKEAGGYLEQYEMRNISYSYKREDFPNLTDDQYANFRNITTTGIAAGVLYRSSSPINPEIGRNTYADAAFKKARITVVMNLADSEEVARAYEGFDETYYSSTKFICLNMSLDVLSDEFRTQLVKGLKFFANNKGVYAVHCTEGRQRAGYVSALLECFMGASAKEVLDDYMTTYYNYYQLTESSKLYNVYVEEFTTSLEKTFGVDDIYSANLSECASKFFKSIGMTDEEISSLRANLSVKETKKVVPQTGANSDSYVWLAMALAAGAAVLCMTVKMRGKS